MDHCSEEYKLHKAHPQHAWWRTYQKVFHAQKYQPTSGDFVELVLKDLKNIGITYEEAIKNQLTKSKLKNLSKCAVYKDLLNKQQEHLKVCKIKYDVVVLQPCLTSKLFQPKIPKIVTAIKSKCVRGI